MKNILNLFFKLALELLYILVWLVFITPFFIMLSLKRNQLFWQIKQKIYSSKPSIKRLLKNKKYIIIQGASLGEAIFAIRLAKILQHYMPGVGFVFFTNTKTGFDYLTNNSHIFNSSLVHIFPLDVSFKLNKFFNPLTIISVIIIESEYWLNFINYVSKKKIPIFSVNSRLSDSSYKLFKFFSYLGINSLKQIDRFYYTAEYTKDNLLKLGISAKRLLKTTSFKIELINEVSNAKLQQEKISALPQELNPKFWFVVGSLHPEEIKIILAAWQDFSKKVPDSLMVIIPRHPNKQAEFLAKIKHYYTNNSDLKDLSINPKLGVDKDYCLVTGNILLVNKFGVSRIWYQLADCVFVGGSLNNRGGQNFLEPISLKKFTATGPNLINFQAEKNLFVNAGVLNIVHNKQDLTHFLTKAYVKDEAYKKARLTGYSLIKSNFSALENTAVSIVNYLK